MKIVEWCFMKWTFLGMVPEIYPYVPYYIVASKLTYVLNVEKFRKRCLQETFIVQITLEENHFRLRGRVPGQQFTLDSTFPWPTNAIRDNIYVTYLTNMKVRIEVRISGSGDYPDSNCWQDNIPMGIIHTKVLIFLKKICYHKILRKRQVLSNLVFLLINKNSLINKYLIRISVKFSETPL